MRVCACTQAEGEAAVSRFKALLRQYQESTKELLEIEVGQQPVWHNAA